MFGTAMPKTTIYKYSQSICIKNEIRLSENRLMTTPTFNTIHSKKFCKFKLGLLIPTSTNAGHNLRALCFGENIRHIKLATCCQLAPHVANKYSSVILHVIGCCFYLCQLGSAGAGVLYRKN
jgi:hypothetical protein